MIDVDYYQELLENILDISVENDYSDISQYTNPIYEIIELLENFRETNNES